MIFPGGSHGKVSAYNAYQRPGFNPWVGKISWRRKCHPTPVLLPGKSHEWWNLVGYSPWGHKELDTIMKVLSEEGRKSGGKLKISLGY